jgi:2-polyprenyl-3-methyl-5-hydroxy-6-metoxy-1,4-benzoquinol methylase
MGGYDGSMPSYYRVQRDWLKATSRDHRIVVDVGCGAGTGLTSMFDGALRSCLIGVDLSRDSLLRASERGVAPVESDIDGCSLPFRTDSVDVVVLDEILEHVAHTDILVDEAFRILKPNGVLLVSTPNLASWFNRIALIFGIQPAFSEVSYRKIYGRPGTEVVGHLRLFTARSLRSFLSESGFRVEKFSGVSFGALPRWLRPLDRLMSLLPTLAGGLVVCLTKRNLTRSECD